MKKSIFTFGILCAVLLFSAGTAKALGIKEGQWSMTTVIQMPGMDDDASEAMEEMENMAPEEKAMMQQMMGGMKIGAAGGGMGMTTTMTQCLSNDNPVPEASDQEGCQETHTVNGNTVSFESVCADSHSTGQVTYRNDKMNGTITSTQTSTGQQVTINISGQYVGPCEQGSANLSVPGLPERELAIKQKELELKAQELSLKQKELEMQSGAKAANLKQSEKSALENVSDAVNTGNNVKNTFGGLKSLLGR